MTTRYTRDHEWIRLEGDIATVGITDYAQGALGDLVFVEGRASDPDGVDTVYFEIGGLNQSFLPLNGEGADTVTFALQLSTLGHTGTMATVRVYAVDLLGDRGSAVTRQIRIQ